MRHLFVAYKPYLAVRSRELDRSVTYKLIAGFRGTDYRRVRCDVPNIPLAPSSRDET